MPRSCVSNLFPFNGTCTASEGADVVLIFDDKTELKTHRFLLSRASPLLRDILDCPESAEIHLRQTDVLPWRIILNLLLPLAPVRDCELIRDDSLDAVMREANKYNVTSVLTRIENAITQSLMHQAQERGSHALLGAMFLRDEKRLMVIAGRYRFKRAKAATIRILGCILGNAVRRGAAQLKQGKWLCINGVEFRVDDLRQQGYEDVFAFFECCQAAICRRSSK